MRLFSLTGAERHDPGVEAWFSAGDDEGRRLARAWFDRMKSCGADVGELLHDGHRAACVGDAAFDYVRAFSGRVNVGCFQGAELQDPMGLLQGAGRFMRHVKLRWGLVVDAEAMNELHRADV